MAVLWCNAFQTRELEDMQVRNYSGEIIPFPPSPPSPWSFLMSTVEIVKGETQRFLPRSVVGKKFYDGSMGGQ